MGTLVKRKILVIGNSNIDFLLKTPYIPMAGQSILSDGTYCFVPGGKGANTAIAAVRMGADVAFCSSVGDDAYGDRLLELFRQNGISPSHINIDRKHQTGLSVVLLEKNGHSRTIVYHGANISITPDKLDGAFSSRPEIAVIGANVHKDTVVLAAKYCRENSIPLVLDLAEAPADIPFRKIGKVEIVSPNESQIIELTGIRPNTLDDCLRACLKICGEIPSKYVVLRLGERGSYIYDGTYCKLCTPYTVDVVDSTAAGDAFIAALSYMYVNTGDIYKSCSFANAVGALTVTRVGAMNSIPKIGEVIKFMDETEQI